MSVRAHIRIRFAVRGGHVHTEWFSGKTALTTHGKNGELVFTLEEWATFQTIVQAGRFREPEYQQAIEFIEEP